jgi:hypothetical protein
VQFFIGDSIMKPHTRTSPSCLANTLAATCALAFIIIAPIAFMLFSSNVVLTNPGTYKRAMARENSYQEFSAAFSQQIVYELLNPCATYPSTAKDCTPPDYLQALSSEDWQNIIGLLMPPDWLKQQSESVIDQFFVFLHGSNTTFTPTISLDGMRAELDQAKISQAIGIVLEDAHPCSVDDLLTLAQIALGNRSLAVPVCQPPEAVRGVVQDSLSAILLTFSSSIPDQIHLPLLPGDGSGIINSPTTTQELTTLLNRVRTYLKYAQLGTILLLFIPAGLLLFILLFVIRSWRSLFRWWGIIFIFSGIFTLLLALIAVPLLQGWFGGFEQNLVAASAIFPGLLNSLAIMFTSATQSLQIWIAIEAGILLATGCIMLILSFFIKASR